MLRPMRLILRHPLVEHVIPIDDKDDYWDHDQLMQDLKCDGGTNIAAKAQAAMGDSPVVISLYAPLTGGGGESNPLKDFTASDGTPYPKGSIRLDPFLDRANAAQTAIFEQTNLSNGPHYAQVQADAAAGKLDREQYKRIMEAGEYQGVANAEQAFRACGSSWGAPAGAKGRYDDLAKARDFDDYYKNYLSPEHAERHGRVWDQYYKSAYESPPKPEQPSWQDIPFWPGP